MDIVFLQQAKKFRIHPLAKRKGHCLFQIEPGIGGASIYRHDSLEFCPFVPRAYEVSKIIRVSHDFQRKDLWVGAYRDSTDDRGAGDLRSQFFARPYLKCQVILDF